MVYDLRHADTRLRWLVTCLLGTFGVAYLFGAWMVGLYAGFTPRSVAATYRGPKMPMHMPPETTVLDDHGSLRRHVHRHLRPAIRRCHRARCEPGVQPDHPGAEQVRHAERAEQARDEPSEPRVRVLQVVYHPSSLEEVEELHDSTRVGALLPSARGLEERLGRVIDPQRRSERDLGQVKGRVFDVGEDPFLRLAVEPHRADRNRTQHLRRAGQRTACVGQVIITRGEGDPVAQPQERGG